MLIIKRTRKSAPGYADCWYCGHPAMSPWLWKATDRDGRPVAKVYVCDEEQCVEAAESGTLDPVEETCSLG